MTLEILSPNEYADFWRYQVGVNVIPAISKDKIPIVEWKSDVRGNWQEIPIPEEIHQQWKKENKFKDGMAVICGEAFHNAEYKGKWLNGIDCDNKIGLDEICSSGIDKMAQNTLVEQHANKEKCHIYFYTDEPIQSQAPLIGDNIPKIEIKSGGKTLLYCAGSYHKDGSLIEILGTRNVKTVDDKNGLENRINEIFKKYGLKYLKTESQDFKKPVYQVSGILHEGSNRGKHIISYLVSKKIKNPEFNQHDLFALAKKYESEHCADVYDDKKIWELVKQSMGYGDEKLAGRDIEEEELILESDEDKMEWIKMLVKKYDIVNPPETSDIYCKSGVTHKKIIDDIFKNELKQKYVKPKTINDLKYNVEKTAHTDYDPFDNDFIGLENIILDQRFEVAETISRVKSTLQRNYRPELIKNEDIILKTIKEILPEQHEKILAIAVILLRGKNNLKKFPYFDGKPDSAKSFILRILCAFIGVHTQITIQRLQRDTRLLTQVEFLNITDEGENCIIDADVFKNIIDGIGFDESGKYVKELKRYDPTKHLQIGAGNGMPNVSGLKGIAKRITRIHFKKHFEKSADGWEESIITKDNLDRFLLSVIEYGKMNNPSPLLDMNDDQKIELFDKISDPVGYFVEHCMTSGDGDYVVTDWLEDYKKFLFEFNITKEFTDDRLGKMLSQVYGIKSKLKKIDGKALRVYPNWIAVSKTFD